ncbi:MAG: ATP-binding protein, partial [Bacteroidia bacterium]|nr:ATP-binding protein [Bacteroidia bacterium]
HRICYRAIAYGTNQRTIIATILPKNVFYGHSLNADVSIIHYKNQLVVLALLNSFCVDYLIRSMIGANLTKNFFYQLPVPRLSSGDAYYEELLERSARLVCTSDEFADLWSEVYPGRKQEPVPTAPERLRMRAEMDAMVAKIYDLTVEEFDYVLSTFPSADKEHKRLARDIFAGL